MAKIDTFIAADNYFSQIPHWVLYADISPQAIRLYAVLQHYANKESEAWPSRATLAKEIRVSSTRTVDAAMSELTQIGAVIIEHRMIGNEYTSNRYIVVTALPSAKNSVTPSAEICTTSSKILLTKKNQLKITNSTNTDFDDFWNIYPLKVGKGAAMKAFAKAVSSTDVEHIIAGALRYKLDPNRVQAYTAHASTWLNAQRWLDEPLPMRNLSVDEKKERELQISKEKTLQSKEESAKWFEEQERLRAKAVPMPENVRELIKQSLTK